jgi:hypothetical protein
MRARPVAIAIAGAAASGVAVALIRLRRPGSTGTAGGGGRSEAGQPETYRCECGQEFRVSGTGRHRVYWLAGAPDDDPVLSPACPSCDRPLPRDSEVSADQVSVSRGA